MNIVNTLSYYDKKAKEFCENTINADVSPQRERFLGHLAKGDRILDFGCGSGRDTKAFLELGYKVEAIDGSAELCKTASDYTGYQTASQAVKWISGSGPEGKADIHTGSLGRRNDPSFRTFIRPSIQDT